jgi:hypothetical protein
VKINDFVTRFANGTGSASANALGEPLWVVGEYLDWQGHTPEEIQAMKDGIADKEPIDD